MVALVLAFLVGLNIGILVGCAFHLLTTPQTKPAPTTMPKWASLFTKPEPQAPVSTQSMPRTAGPWRRQRKELERMHNSQQQQRDTFIPPEKKNA